MSYSFNPEKAANECIEWIRRWFDENGPGCSAVLGISGGKDSSVAAALCVKALGAERVIGVLMPQGEQFDIEYSHELCELLGIRKIEVNIGKTVEALKAAFPFEPSVQTVTNIPPRIRMAVLYAVSQSNNGRVANTCNFSEDWVGYATRYGDGAGDFGSISHFTVQEVKAIGRYLGLPEKFVEKPPLDGLCGRTDEDNLGFTYAMLDAYIREGIEPPAEIKEKIDRLHRINQFKLRYFDTFLYAED
jgi:NAD+ synthase